MNSFIFQAGQIMKLFVALLAAAIAALASVEAAPQFVGGGFEGGGGFGRPGFGGPGFGGQGGRISPAFRRRDNSPTTALGGLSPFPRPNRVLAGTSQSPA